jgi:hypothetical protein
MRNDLKHALQQPFIFATGLSAGIHSAWSLGTMFSGEMPQPEFSGRFIFWIVPAVLIAFAIDIGQIATSAEIRAGHRSKGKYGTFIVLALATYYLQFIYIVHHMPALEIAEGVALFPGMAELVRNAAVWVIPALLPISTILYTAGTDEQAQNEGTVHLPKELQLGDGEIIMIETPSYSIDCPECGWTGTSYKSETAATNALNRHKGHCPKMTEFSNNGRH